VRLEGATAEALKGSAALLTRTHLDPLLAEHELQWDMLAVDPASQALLAKLTQVDVLITWNVSASDVEQSDVDTWAYTEEWTLQALRIATGELLGSVTLRRHSSWSKDGH
jgi:hypothetical protein